MKARNFLLIAFVAFALSAVSGPLATGANKTQSGWSPGSVNHDVVSNPFGGNDLAVVMIENFGYDLAVAEAPSVINHTSFTIDDPCGCDIAVGAIPAEPDVSIKDDPCNCDVTVPIVKPEKLWLTLPHKFYWSDKPLSLGSLITETVLRT